MGLGDVWGDIQSFWIDISEYSMAEQNKDKYRNIAEQLEKKICICEEHMSQVDDTGSSLHSSFTSNPGAAKGEWKERFDTKETTWNSNRETLVTVMKSALETAKKRKDQAIALSETWAQSERNQEDRIRNEIADKREERRRREAKARKEAAKATGWKW